MRLSFKETVAIQNAARFYLKDFVFRLLLFGSRSDDAKKGGDIDLLFIVPLIKKSEATELKNKIRMKIFEAIPEQRIDITIATEEEIATDEFLRSVLPSAIDLFPSKE
jgi:hypothetical protein